jgi:hypothetical protein
MTPSRPGAEEARARDVTRGSDPLNGHIGPVTFTAVLRLVKAASAVPERERPVEFTAPPQPPPLTAAAARVLAELMHRAMDNDSTADRGSSAA